MKDNVKALALSCLLIPGAAFAQINVGDTVGSTETDILAALEAQGYTSMEIEFEDDEIEVEAMLDGQEYEIEISPETGDVLAINLEDEEEDDDEDEEDETDS
ncbi:PepSY domain-containing protein [Shimia abyssi]|uniref:YpeB-like protein with putative protease inhibitory function n=1 Tax=Shimia abyssi TaxID=1662395 RepID=A0A2P8FCM5_9RHOB|nr:PepSY domain-containing protein [Shimia abyssi]PSL19469.1 YpeB-like protein with putative protease inhibitory function [Shimia abyssi]